jgi:hypothetical protein
MYVDASEPCKRIRQPTRTLTFSDPQVHIPTGMPHDPAALSSLIRHTIPLWTFVKGNTRQRPQLPR